MGQQDQTSQYHQPGGLQRSLILPPAPQMRLYSRLTSKHPQATAEKFLDPISFYNTAFALITKNPKTLSALGAHNIKCPGGTQHHGAMLFSKLQQNWLSRDTQPLCGSHTVLPTRYTPFPMIP